MFLRDFKLLANIEGANQNNTRVEFWNQPTRLIKWQSSVIQHEDILRGNSFRTAGILWEESKGSIMLNFICIIVNRLNKLLNTQSSCLLFKTS